MRAAYLNVWSRCSSAREESGQVIYARVCLPLGWPDLCVPMPLSSGQRRLCMKHAYMTVILSRVLYIDEALTAKLFNTA